MVTKIISKILGIGKEETVDAAVSAPSELRGTGEADPAGLVEFLIQQLGGPQSRIETATGSEGLEISIHCEKQSIGRIIGKKGQTIGAIRRLAFEAAARKKVRVKSIEIIEPDEN